MPVRALRLFTGRELVDAPDWMHRNHPHARKGITTHTGQAEILPAHRHRNHPHARKGITTNLVAAQNAFLNETSESPSCP